MKKSKVIDKGIFVGEPQLEEGKTILNEKQLNELRELSRILNYGEEDYHDGLLNSYSSKGLIDLLSIDVRGKLKSGTIDSEQAHQAFSLINSLDKELN